MAETIQQLCYQLRIQGRYEHEVTDFAKVQGEEATLGILHNIRKQKAGRVNDGMPAKGSVTLFKEQTERYIANKAMSAKEDAKQAERQASHDAYYETVNSGYQPTKEAIRAQVGVLQANDKLSGIHWRPDCDLPMSERLDQERIWAQAGIGLVHGMIVDGVKAENEAETSF